MSRLAGRIKVTFNNTSFQEEFDLKFPSRASRSTAGPVALPVPLLLSLRDSPFPFPSLKMPIVLFGEEMLAL